MKTVAVIGAHRPNKNNSRLLEWASLPGPVLSDPSQSRPLPAKRLPIVVVLAALLPPAYALRAQSIERLPALTDSALEADAGGGAIATAAPATHSFAMRARSGTEVAAGMARAEQEPSLAAGPAALLAGLGLAIWLGRRMRRTRNH